MYKYWTPVLLEEHCLLKKDIAQLWGLKALSGKPHLMMTGTFMDWYCREFKPRPLYYSSEHGMLAVYPRQTANSALKVLLKMMDQQPKGLFLLNGTCYKYTIGASHPPTFSVKKERSQPMSNFRYSSFYTINDCNTRLKTILKSIEKTQTGENALIVANINDIALDLINALDQAINIFSTSEVLSYDAGSKQIRAALDKVNEEYEDVAVILSSLEQITKIATHIINNNQYSISLRSGINRVASMGDDYSFLDKLTEILPDKCRTMTIFHGDIKIELEKCRNFYNELNSRLDLENYVQTARIGYYQDELVKKPERIVQAPIEEMRISNNTFDMLYLPCDFDHTHQTTGMQVLNYNKMKITQYQKYLRPGGIFITVIPGYMFTRDNARHYTKFFEKIHVHEYMAGATGFQKTYLIAGVKKNTEDGASIDPQKANELRLAHYEGTLSEETWPEASEKIRVFPPIELELFRTLNLDDQDIATITSTSGLMENFFNSYHKQVSRDDMAPLLPFNTGQIGLVLASGQLDGVVDEKNGYAHVIKGRIVRTSENMEEEEDGVRHESVVSSSKVQIGIFLADGSRINVA